MGESTDSAARSGLLYGVAAYGLWGLMPLYFSAVPVSSQEMLAQRIVWSAFLLAAVLTAFSRWKVFAACLARRRTAALLGLSTLLIGLNWYAFIYGVMTRQTLQTSLGYFILPLVNVAIGMIFFGERLRTAQAVAITLATCGVVVLVAANGAVPWIALCLAFSFSLYGVIRKQVPVDGVTGLSVETFLLTPIALAFLALWATEGQLGLGAIDRGTDAMIVLSGLATTVPLVCFAQAVRRLRLVTIGFLQYLSPTIAFLVAVLALGEEFTPAHQKSFALIWAGLAVFVFDALRSATRRGESRELPSAARPRLRAPRLARR